MIYTLTLNPALDYNIYKKESLAKGALNLIEKANYTGGGKGINVSKVLANMELASTTLGFIGGFTGQYIADDIAKNEYVVNNMLRIDGNTRINVKLKDGGSETEIAGISPEIKPKDITRLFEQIKLIEDGDILVLAGSVPKDVADDIYIQISKMIDKKVKVVLDTRGNLIDKNIHNNFLIKPNIHELEEMFAKKLDTDDAIVNTCKYFLAKGVENVLVSKGGDGAILIRNDAVFKAGVPKGSLINSVGAGDSTIAGFITGITKGYTIQNSFRLAISCGSATAYSYKLADKEAIERLYDEVKIEELSVL